MFFLTITVLSILISDEMKKLEVGYIAQKKIFVIKKPGVNIAKDFSIVFT